MATNDSNTVLLVDCDGDQDSTAFVNRALGSSVGTFSPAGTGRVDRAQKKFGDASLRCQGGGHLRVNSFAFSFAANPFTLDAWVYVADANQAHALSWYVDESNYFAVEVVQVLGGAVKYGLRYRLAGVERFAVAGASAVMVLGGWHHFAVTRASDKVRLFLDGNEQCAYTIPDSPGLRFDLANWPLLCGRSKSSTASGLLWLDGWIDEIRVSRVADWTANFTPPTLRYPLRWEAVLRGTSSIKNTFETAVRGTSNTIIACWETSLRGTSKLLNSFEASPRGTSRVKNTFEASLRGTSHNTIGRWEASLRGASSIKNTFEASLRGKSNVYTQSYEASLRGRSHMFNRFEASLRGKSHILYAYEISLRGQSRIENAALARYELFYGFGAVPDLEAAPWQTFTSVPCQTPAITGAGKHYFVLRRRNRWGLQSKTPFIDHKSGVNVASWVLELNASNNEIVLAPTGPELTIVTAEATRKVRVKAWYPYLSDDSFQADQWLVYVRSNGTDPVPASDTPAAVVMVKRDGLARMDWLSTSYTQGADVRVIVRTRRTGANGRDSANLDVHSVVATGTAPAIPVIDQYQTIGAKPVRLRVH